MSEAWAAAGPAHGLQVIAHVGSHAIEDARRLARTAGTLGLSGISTLAPSYFKPRTLTDLIDWCAAIAAEAPALPFYYYDIPSMTQVSFPIELFLVEAAARIPTLAGVKVSNPDLVSYRRGLDAAAGRFDLPWGTDEALLAALATGAKGGVGSTYNWAHPLYVGLRDAFGRGDLDEARRRQSLSIAMVDAIAATGFMGTVEGADGPPGRPGRPGAAPHGNPTAVEVDARGGAAGRARLRRVGRRRRFDA